MCLARSPLPVVLLGIFVSAALATGLYSQRAEVDKAISDALSSTPEASAMIPRAALPFVHSFVYVAIPFVAFILVTCVASFASCCCLGGSAREEHVPMGLPVAPVGAGIPYQQFAAATAPPTMQFADSLFSCSNDPKLCLASWCCPSLAIAQLWERVMAGGSKGAFWAVFLPLALASLLVAWAQKDCPQPTLECDPAAVAHGQLSRCKAFTREMPLICSLSSTAQAAAGLAAIALLVILRCERAHHSARRALPAQSAQLPVPVRSFLTRRARLHACRATWCAAANVCAPSTASRHRAAAHATTYAARACAGRSPRASWPATWALSKARATSSSQPRVSPRRSELLAGGGASGVVHVPCVAWRERGMRKGPRGAAVTR